MKAFLAFLPLAVVFGLGTATLALADTEPRVYTTDQTQTTVQNTAYRVTAAPRAYATGVEVAVFGGVDLAQEGNMTGHGAAFPGSLSFDPSDRIGGVFGAKLGYTWPGWRKGPGFDGDTTRQVDDHFTLLPSIEYEFLYLNRELDGQAAGGERVDTDFTASVFSVNPILRAQYYMFRPYVGFGVGGAYLEAHGPEFVSPGGVVSRNSGTPDDIALALQAIAGTDVFITKHISLFGEYKFLNFLDPNFSTPTVEFKAKDFISENLLTAGIRYHF